MRADPLVNHICLTTRRKYTFQERTLFQKMKCKLLKVRRKNS